MHKKLIQIKKIFEIEIGKDVETIAWDEPDWQAIEINSEFHAYVEKEELCISFYSGTDPTTVAFYIRCLNLHKVVDYYVMENMYPKINDKEEYVELLFGDEADNEYKQCIYKQIYKDLAFACQAITYGPKQ